jgi:hypothetical protein
MSFIDVHPRWKTGASVVASRRLVRRQKTEDGRQKILRARSAR